MTECEFCDQDDPDELFRVWMGTERMADPDEEPTWIGCPSCPGQGNIDVPDYEQPGLDSFG